MYEIMIVDDDAQVLDMVELVLKREGYHVLRAFSAKSALETIENETPDLFVIDAMMPDMDGLTLCRRLRAMPRTTNTPIIFLTGNNSPHTVVDALNSGGDDFIRKPFVPRELAARVRAHIRRSVFYSDGDVAAIRIQSNRYRVYVNDAEVLLTRVEFDLLKYLCTSPYRLHSTEELLANVAVPGWGGRCGARAQSCPQPAS
ncbi:MAG: response regulator transcription factor [Chloroflexi bacterium]|uniref:response regulator transcription factor n=1 Tax=Candidatus Flexifilum breve TaxID=3140694 RepID=UPI003136D8B9|nr:response regulator transcription factor [Chloroflexota bacterium]